MEKKEIRTTMVQLIKYGIVGVSNSLITLAVILVCNELLGLKLMLADVIGYIAGVINSFIWNKNWVFKSHNHRLRYEMSLFLIGFLLCFGLQFLTVLVLRNPMKALDITLLGMPSDVVVYFILPPSLCAKSMLMLGPPNTNGYILFSMPLRLM